MSQPRSEFLWKVHAYMNEHIRFADTKAITVIAWSGAMLSTLVANNAFTNFLDGHLWAEDSRLIGWITLVAFTLLAASFFCAIQIIAPNTRYGQAGPSGLIFWGAVCRYKNADEYSDAVAAVANLDERIAIHVYELACIAKKKFARVTVSIWLAAAGTLPAVFVIFQL
jgi:Family of unknown function (DUF5706)